MSFYYSIPLVVTAELAEAQRLLGKEILRILDYYQEDGAKSIAQIEQALANGDPSAMVLPAHTLKGESRQFGAARLGDIAEAIENAARNCVEHHRKPDEVDDTPSMQSAVRLSFSYGLPTSFKSF